MSEQERPSTGGRRPYQSHQRGKSYLYDIGSDGNAAKKHDANDNPIEPPSARLEDFMAKTPEGSKVDWNVDPSVVLNSPHKRKRSSVTATSTKKQKEGSIKSLAGSLRKIYRTESPIDRTLWEAGDYLIETNHLFDRTAAVFSKFRDAILEKYYGHEYCTETIKNINAMAVIHDTLYGDPDKRGILRKLEDNDELYRKEGGLREKVDTFYNDF